MEAIIKQTTRLYSTITLLVKYVSKYGIISNIIISEWATADSDTHRDMYGGHYKADDTSLLHHHLTGQICE